MPQTFYNTTSESGKQLTLFTQKASSQDERILQFFKKHSDHSFSASDILVNGVCKDGVPITSIRRSINTLMKQMEINQCKKKESLYGRPEYTYQYNSNQITKS